MPPAMKLLHLSPLAALLLASCGLFADKPKPYNVSVAYDPSTIEFFRIFPSVEVDMIAADETTLKQLEGTEINDYFDPAGVLRSSLRKKTFYFSEEDSGSKTLAKDDKAWDNWIGKRHATHLVLFTSLHRDSDKGPDMRKLVLPLNSARWEEDDIEVSIVPAGLLLQTPMNPEEE